VKLHDLIDLLRCKFADIVAEKFTGCVRLTVNFTQGGIGKVHIERGEFIK